MAALVVALAASVARPARGATRPPASAATAAERAATEAEAATTPANGQPDRIAVVPFVGAGGPFLRAAVGETLLHPPASDGVPPVALVDAPTAAGESFWAQAAELGRRWRLAALIHGYTYRSGRVVYLTLTVLAGDDGADLGQVKFSARTKARLATTVRNDLWPRLAPLLAHARATQRHGGRGGLDGVAASAVPAGPPTAALPPSPATSPPAEAAVPAEQAADDRLRPAPQLTAKTPIRQSAEAVGHAPDSPSLAWPPPSAAEPRRCSMVEVDVGGGVLLRAFDYRDEQRGALRAYYLRRAPVGRGEATVYPFARCCGRPSAFGLRAHYERMSDLQSKLADRSLATSAWAWSAELLARIALGRRWVLSPAAGYYVHSFTVAGDVVPRIANHSWGGAVEARLRLATLVLELGVGVHRVINTEQLQSATWFPGLTGMTYTGQLRLGAALTDWLEVMVGAYGEYASFNFHIQETGAYPNGVAAGAYDAYLTGLLSVRVRWPAPGRLPR